MVLIAAGRAVRFEKRFGRLSGEVTAMEPGTTPTSQKIEVFTEWMKGDHVLLHLDARAPGVEVPAHLGQSPNLSLKLSYLFSGETKYDETAVSAYLRFSGEYFLCVIPWTAVWGISSSEGDSRVWPSDLPKELAHIASTLNEPPLNSKEPAAPSLSVVGKGGGKKGPVLRRVK